MSSAEDAYLNGWRQLQHDPTCSRPEWVVDVRVQPDLHRSRHGGPHHSCPNEDCGHGDRCDRLQVRVVCRTCGRAHLFTGEEHSQEHTTTTVLGYGSAPRRMSGLCLWPGPPMLSDPTRPPWELLVTRERVHRVTDRDVVALIGQHRSPRGAVRWYALAVPDPAGQWGIGDRRWARSSEGHKTPSAAAKWVAAALEDADGGDTR